MKNGDKVVCVDDSKNADFPQYNSPLTKGCVYVVRAAVMTPSGKIGLQLLGVALPPEWGHQSFSPSRFRLLSEMKVNHLSVHLQTH